MTWLIPLLPAKPVIRLTTSYAANKPEIRKKTFFEESARNFYNIDPKFIKIAPEDVLKKLDSFECYIRNESLESFGFLCTNIQVSPRQLLRFEDSIS
jgi:hypothetical protein